MNQTFQFNVSVNPLKMGINLKIRIPIDTGTYTVYLVEQNIIINDESIMKYLVTKYESSTQQIWYMIQSFEII